MPEQGDIVLVPVPFTDLSSQKRRPVVVVSNDVYNRAGADIVVVAMTSNPAEVPFSFRIRRVVESPWDRTCQLLAEITVARP